MMEIHNIGTVNIFNINNRDSRSDVINSALKTVIALKKVDDQVKKDELVLKVIENG